MKGVVIAGTHSGCGKTTITLGILAALRKKGCNVRSFKAGPDFIDSGLHRMISGKPSINLDLWMCGPGAVVDSYRKYSAGTDMAVIEGVMGMYDGEFSTASLAEVLGLPVILVVDAYGMAESAGAMVKGFQEYSAEVRKRGRQKSMEAQKCGSVEDNDSLTSDLQIFRSSDLVSGVIFNHVASERHYERLKQSVAGIPVLGYLPRDNEFEIPHRHLGLTVAEENPVIFENIGKLADAVLKYIDIESIGAGGQQCGSAKAQEYKSQKTAEGSESRALKLHNSSTHQLRIAVAYDKAFSFYYQENLDMLTDAGAEIAMFSPLTDHVIPDGTDCVYIGGGYPELCAAELSANKTMLRSIRDWADAGKPLYAECGGLMYLSQGIYDFSGSFFKMAGIFPFETRMKKERCRLGYREIALKSDCLLGKKAAAMRGHEFHYSEIIAHDDDLFSSQTVDSGKVEYAYSMKDSSGHGLQDEGYHFKNTLASYVHLHFGSNPAVARNIIDFAMERHGAYTSHRPRKS